MRSVEVDRHSGFCGGVIRAISAAEEFLDGSGRKLYSLGAIVHNEEELSRLESRGLVAVESSDIDKIPHEEDKTLLIRAHGVPPQVFDKARALGFDIIDCTCPVVLKLQKDIRTAYENMRQTGGQIVIFGKIGHPEVLGLVGQADGHAVVIENLEQLKQLLAEGVVNPEKDIELFSQTTKSPAGYSQLYSYLKSVMNGASLTIHDTICSQVATRYRELSDFARNHDVIIFVSGRTSSNGKVLCDLCKSMNIRTYHIGSIEELQPAWFRADDRVGICGATSTPKWLLENVAAAIENLH